MQEPKKEANADVLDPFAGICGAILQCDPSLIPRFSFEGYSSLGLVCEVYSGDSVTILFHYKGEITKISARLKGVSAYRDSEKDRDAMDYLWEATGRGRGLVGITFGRFDKYGHPLVVIYSGNLCINHDIVHRGLARELPGRRREVWQPKRDSESQ